MAQQKAAIEVGILTCGFFGPDRAEAGDAPVATQVHDMLCSFKLRSSAEETYSDKQLSVNLLGEHKGTLLWWVKARFLDTAPPPGFLQQSYAPDAQPPPD